MNLINIFAICSYLYLFFCLQNNYYNIIFIYFITLFIGFLIFNKNIFILNTFILIFHYFNIIKEGNKNSDEEWDEAIERSNKRPVEPPQPPIGENEIDNMQDIGNQKQEKIKKINLYDKKFN